MCRPKPYHYNCSVCSGDIIARKCHGDYDPCRAAIEKGANPGSNLFKKGVGYDCPDQGSEHRDLDHGEHIWVLCKDCENVTKQNVQLSGSATTKEAATVWNNHPAYGPFLGKYCNNAIHLSDIGITQSLDHVLQDLRGFKNSNKLKSCKVVKEFLSYRIGDDLSSA